MYGEDRASLFLTWVKGLLSDEVLNLAPPSVESTKPTKQLQPQLLQSKPITRANGSPHKWVRLASSRQQVSSTEGGHVYG